jgi:putative ABC transport system substrate-binding protein
MHSRRRLLSLLGTGLLAVPFRTSAQQPANTVPRLGILLFNTPQIDPIAPLFEGLKALGYEDGKTIRIDYRFAEGKFERLPDLAADLVRLKPDVIFAYGGDVAPHAKKATSSIPIIAMVSNDPVQSGLVESIGKPGANVTGLTLIYDDLAGKVLELLREAVPGISRVAVLWNPEHADPEFRETQRAAAAHGVQLQSVEIRRAEDFEAAFRAILDERAQGLIVVSTRLLFQRRQQIAEFVARNRLPAAGGWGDWTKDGLLLTYGPNTAEPMRRVATYVDKVLKGARPAELPIERPAKFELVVNLRAAKALGITIPPLLLARADEMVE